MNARNVILNRIRTAIGPSPAVPTVPRDYHTSGQHSPGSPALLELFTDRLTDYKATVHTCTPAELPATLARITDGWRIAVATGLGVALPSAVRDEPPLSNAELDSIDAAVTFCTAACADTGTIALDSGQGRRALTLIPDRHVCVVYAHQVVQTIPELIRRLDPRRPLTFISGPSATSDIELDRVEGVHGPRTLIVVLVSDTDSGQ